jgi:hypothetical protein
MGLGESHDQKGELSRGLLQGYASRHGWWCWLHRDGASRCRRKRQSNGEAWVLGLLVAGLHRKRRGGNKE